LPVSPVPAQPAWWQWPTILSLDAPAITLLWQVLIADATGAALGWPHLFVLAASVWLAYAGDRWIEGWRLNQASIRTPRHRFYQRRRWSVAALCALVLAADIAVAGSTLSQRELIRGLLLACAVLAYLLSHQWLHRHSRWRVPKEIVIASLLGAGVALFLVETPRVALLWWTVPLFTWLCFTNCALISLWERTVDLSHGQTSLALGSGNMPATIAWLPWIAVGLSAAVVFIAPAAVRDVAICALVSGGILAGVARVAPHIGWPRARVLSDLALMTPAAWLVFR
jgi:hypothetical protein